MNSKTPYEFFKGFCDWLECCIKDYDELIADPDNSSIVDYLRGCRITFYDILVYFKYCHWNG